MRGKRLICAVATGAALIDGRPSIADPNDTTVVSEVTVVARRPYLVSGLMVSPGRTCPETRHPANPEIPPPKLVSSFPERGAVVRPGILILRLTFDLPMACDGLLDSHAPLPNPCPSPLHDPLLSFDRRTFLTVCMIQKSSHYGLWINRSPERPFTSLAGRPADANELVFDTSAEPEVVTVQEAMAQDRWLQEAMRPKSEAESR